MDKRHRRRQTRGLAAQSGEPRFGSVSLAMRIWGDKVVGFPPVLDKLGYKLVDPGRYQNLTDDFTAQIAAFKKAECDIITGVVLPPDFTTFWNQALQQGLKPKIASVGKAILFPSAVEALGKNGNNLSSVAASGARKPQREGTIQAGLKAIASAASLAARKFRSQRTEHQHSACSALGPRPWRNCRTAFPPPSMT
jgi:branched-chain amino acid transport system substrate-binding protein